MLFNAFVKKSLRFAIPPILLVLLVLGWKWTHPNLSDEDQIRQSLEGIATQASRKSSSGVTSFLSKDFRMDGFKRKDITQQLTIGMLQYAAINMKVSNVQVQTNGDTATSTGNYEVGLKPEFSSPEQKTSAQFTLKWKREDGKWKISGADGNKLPPGLGG